MYTGSPYEGYDIRDAVYGDMGSAIELFENWIMQFIGSHNNLYSPIEHAYDCDNTALGEDGEQSYSANSYIEAVIDNLAIIYPSYDFCINDINMLLKNITNMGFDNLIEEANEFFCECDQFSDYEQYV